MTTYGEYRNQNRLIARYRREIRSYGTHGDLKEAMIEASLTAFGYFGNPGLPHHYAGVYFIASGPSIKIGEAIDPYERMRDFNGHNPHGLELLHVIARDSKDARRRLEKQLHLRFEHLRLPDHREWFQNHPELTGFIGSICSEECYP
ncbi:GIY-YIG nuclease family protein [Verrucosispora sp. WMMD1129]|uniref:GIY-YIG nuclease family protein n=1 Tax=Verrucosispora sp. WMMD1129 TaxID=3016093 RepID=UPI002499CC09|nr:GIY-YIG nuclease family protein [Verrucosispora sp. WMMD1129]WFE47641.1 GIY-YIG nuclease family protein [Verrucosispora sp. WMMD1129]